MTTNEGETCSISPGPDKCRRIYERPEFNAAFWSLASILLIAWAVLAWYGDVGGRIIWGIIALTLLFGCKKTRRSVSWNVPAMYLPYVGLWNLNGATDLEGTTWFSWWPRLPVYAFAEVATNYWLQVGLAVACFFAVIVAGRPSDRAAKSSAGVVLVLSLANAWFISQSIVR
ncbi:MAG: hypothetical protein KDB03_12190 [Planctomycetales bacterium]|nr:hypothetical protein [Planctomycetales bacterium]